MPLVLLVLLPVLVPGISLRTCLVTLSQHFRAAGGAAVGEVVVVEVVAAQALGEEAKRLRRRRDLARRADDPVLQIATSANSRCTSSPIQRRMVHADRTDQALWGLAYGE